MQRLLTLSFLALATLLSGCAHTIKIAAGSPPPRIALHPARDADHKYLPKLEHYFQQQGYRVVHSGASDYDLNFSVSDQRVFVEVNMQLFNHGDSDSTAVGKVYANPRYVNQAGVVDAAIDEALDDLESPSIRIMPAKHSH